jgi:ribosomal subunit interface protein
MVERITGVVAKFFSGTMSGHLTVTQEGTGFLTDCILHLSSGVDVQAHAMAYDAYLSADKVADIIEKRLRRYKQRLKDHAPPNGNSRIVEVPSYVIKSPEDEEDELEGTEFHPVVIAETKKNMKTIPVSEAVLELDMTGVSVLVFRHAGSGRVNLVYRRSDGNIGWVDPPTLDT